MSHVRYRYENYIHLMSMTLTKEVFHYDIYKLKKNICFYKKKIWPIVEERWYQISRHSGDSIHRQIHRTDGPAIIVKNQQTRLVLNEHWVVFDETHRINGPAIVEYDKYGIKTREYWYVHGVQHRLDGPSCIMLRNGVKTCWWFEFGVCKDK